MATHPSGAPFLKSSNAVTARPETARASITAISMSCLTPERYLRTASQIAQTKLKDVDTKGDVERVVQSICLTTFSYVQCGDMSSTAALSPSPKVWLVKNGSVGSKKGDRALGVYTRYRKGLPWSRVSNECSGPKPY